LRLQLKAVQLIKRAEVIVYDDLGTQVPLPSTEANMTVLLLHWQAFIALVCTMQEALDELARPSAERRYVGKRGQKQSIKQPEIDDLLVGLCQQVTSNASITQINAASHSLRVQLHTEQECPLSLAARELQEVALQEVTTGYKRLNEIARGFIAKGDCATTVV